MKRAYPWRTIKQKNSESFRCMVCVNVSEYAFAFGVRTYKNRRNVCVRSLAESGWRYEMARAAVIRNELQTKINLNRQTASLEYIERSVHCTTVLLFLCAVHTHTVRVYLAFYFVHANPFCNLSSIQHKNRRLCVIVLPLSYSWW